MNKNASGIAAGIRTLVKAPHEIISGTIVPGSLDTAALTISVQPPDDSLPVTGVLLNTISNSDAGYVMYPADNSHVVIGSIDGPGAWILLRANELTKTVVKIGSVSCTIVDGDVTIQNGDTLLDVGSSTFKLNTSGENLFTFLKDLLTYICALTVPTAAGNSGVPLNIADFNNLITRLGNLLAS